MTEQLKYTVSEDGHIIAIGYLSILDTFMTNEPFTFNDFWKWQKINSEWIYVGENIDIPTGAMVDYVMSSPCPKDPTLTRHIYWVGENHEADQHFTINLMVLHFNPDGSRNRKYDCKTWTRADKGMMMVDPLNPDLQVDEYEFFVSMVGSTYMPQLVQLGIYAAEDVLNIRIYENQ